MYFLLYCSLLFTASAFEVLEGGLLYNTSVSENSTVFEELYTDDYDVPDDFVQLDYPIFRDLFGYGNHTLARLRTVDFWMSNGTISEDYSHLENEILDYSEEVVNDYQPRGVHINTGSSNSDMQITWYSALCSDQVHLYYGNSLTADFMAVQPEFEPFKSGSVSRCIYDVYLQLSAGTRYFYNIVGPGIGTQICSFVTLADEPYDGSNMIIYGDLGNSNAASISNIVAEGITGFYDAILHNGDFAYDMYQNNGVKGTDFLDMISPVAARVPYFTSPGNHEYFGGVNATHYVKHFRDPDVREHAGFYYSFNLGRAHHVVINTELFYYKQYGIDILENMYNWLLKDLVNANLKANRQKYPWIIVYGHRPMYCSPKNHDDCKNVHCKVRVGTPELPHVRLEHLFNRHRVDLLIWAHEHNYERLHAIYDYNLMTGDGSNFSFYNHPRAPVHVITGTAGNYEHFDGFPDSEPPAFTVFRALAYGYARMVVHNATHLTFMQVGVWPNVTSSIIDRFTIYRNLKLYDDFPVYPMGNPEHMDEAEIEPRGLNPDTIIKPFCNANTLAGTCGNTYMMFKDGRVKNGTTCPTRYLSGLPLLCVLTERAIDDDVWAVYYSQPTPLLLPVVSPDNNAKGIGLILSSTSPCSRNCTFSEYILGEPVQAVKRICRIDAERFDYDCWLVPIDIRGGCCPPVGKLFLSDTATVAFMDNYEGNVCYGNDIIGDSNMPYTWGEMPMTPIATWDHAVFGARALFLSTDITVFTPNCEFLDTSSIAYVPQYLCQIPITSVVDTNAFAIHSYDDYSTLFLFDSDMLLNWNGFITILVKNNYHGYHFTQYTISVPKEFFFPVYTEDSLSGIVSHSVYNNLAKTKHSRCRYRFSEYLKQVNYHKVVASASNDGFDDKDKLVFGENDSNDTDSWRVTRHYMTINDNFESLLRDCISNPIFRLGYRYSVCWPEFAYQFYSNEPINFKDCARQTLYRYACSVDTPFFGYYIKCSPTSRVCPPNVAKFLVGYPELKLYLTKQSEMTDWLRSIFFGSTYLKSGVTKTVIEQGPLIATIGILLCIWILILIIWACLLILSFFEIITIKTSKTSKLEPSFFSATIFVAYFYSFTYFSYKGYSPLFGKDVAFAKRQAKIASENFKNKYIFLSFLAIFLFPLYFTVIFLVGLILMASSMRKHMHGKSKT